MEVKGLAPTVSGWPDLNSIFLTRPPQNVYSKETTFAPARITCQQTAIATIRFLEKTQGLSAQLRSEARCIKPSR